MIHGSDIPHPCYIHTYVCKYTGKVWNDSCKLILMLFSEEGSEIDGGEEGMHFLLFSSFSQKREVLLSRGYFPMSPDVF